ncbi:TPA: EAL domain-containing protein [Burkholderia territorii]|uniref:EAL domain-containing protein n=1 Tax=Burkholderia territorii TaxID=1503055 RepID=UPI0011CBE9CC|nr:EAL domain-containing protein [Burkholderia territorii]TXG02914.1 EAL domain-containing protein [Burkholderia territorii]HDR8861725.1 EAL domain-containing protein [Burkholderia territorii]HDR8864822.1 EAL domain-containing protein [Burkholderia territorii]HDR8870140.1 EAL domain-containing protein [Burkholderia territorii]HDR8877775.1 EAL domain-containing protein [Burkholderia territorii]
MFSDKYHAESISVQQRKDVNFRDDLRIGLLQREFFVVYQPVVDVASRIVVSYEALVRWQHPIRGLVMPEAFIEKAERTGLILLITADVLEQVCRKLKIGSRSRHQLPISVNLSAVCLATGTVPDAIRSVLQRFDVSPEKLILEITETAPLEPFESVLVQLEELRAMDIKIVLDDFGAGYSSLANLGRYPLSGLKVDRSLLEDIPHDERPCLIVASVIDLVRRLGLSVVVEGVESERQLDWIRQFPDVLAQGNLFGMPKRTVRRDSQRLPSTGGK